MSRIILLFILTFSLTNRGASQQVIPLYPGQIPNSKNARDEEKSEQRDGITIISKISRPTLSVFLPAKTNTPCAAVIIFPGGGYWVNAFSHEGTDVAKVFNEWGVAAIVVKYRIPSDVTMVNREIGPLQDAQQAVKVVRQRASEWGINPNQIGVMGFSAGGHLASTLSTHFSRSLIPDDGISLRPDFQILVYPVITFQDNVAHKGSSEQLLGKTPPKEKLDYYSNELQVNEKTPPALLVHASDDTGVKPDNSILFYQALIKNKVPAELHIYQSGGHGFGMYLKTSSDLWMERCRNWMTSSGWIK